MTTRSSLWRKKHTITSKLYQDVNKCNIYIRHDVKRFVASQIRHDAINRSWCQKVRHEVKNFVLMSKTRHNDKRFITSKSLSWSQKVCHDVKNMSWWQTVCHDVKNTSYDDDTKYFVSNLHFYDVSSPGYQRVCVFHKFGDFDAFLWYLLTMPVLYPDISIYSFVTIGPHLTMLWCDIWLQTSLNVEINFHKMHRSLPWL